MIGKLQHPFEFSYSALERISDIAWGIRIYFMNTLNLKEERGR